MNASDGAKEHHYACQVCRRPLRSSSHTPLLNLQPTPEQRTPGCGAGPLDLGRTWVASMSQSGALWFTMPTQTPLLR